MYVANGTCFTSKSSVGRPVWKGTILPPDDGLQMGPKHVEVW
jgi:hypothetical protein